MTTPGSDAPPPDDLADEFNRLGQNLKAALKSAWESEESQRLRRELRVGLAAVEAGLTEAARDFAESEKGQRLKAEVDDLGQRVRSGEVEAKLRAELLAALRAVNAGLQQLTRQAGEPESGEGGTDMPPPPAAG